MSAVGVIPIASFAESMLKSGIDVSEWLSLADEQIKLDRARNLLPDEDFISLVAEVRRIWQARQQDDRPA